MPEMRSAPVTGGVLETSLYVEDPNRSAEFYQDLFGFESLFQDDRVHAMSVAGKHVLLLFKRGAAASTTGDPGTSVPGHDGCGHLHLAFSIDRSELECWEEWLRQKCVTIESRVEWPRGGRSLYFRDPDGHSIELVTPQTWAIY